MEIGYGGNIEALPEETGRNRRIKLPPVATAPLLYSERFAVKSREAKF